MRQYQRPYFDACLFIAWIMGEVKEGIDRGEIVQHLFRLARQGQLKIYTSTLSIAEAHKHKGDGLPRLNPSDTDLILAYFEQEFFVFIDVDRNIAEEAHRHCHTYRLAPNDAIHLASAERAGCDVLLTWDGDLHNINHPVIKTEEPVMVSQTSKGAESES